MAHILHTLQPDKSAPISISLLGVRVDRLTQQQLLAAIESLLQDYRASERQAHCQQVVTLNPEFVMTAQRNAVFRQCINEAALVAPDGIGVVLAGRYLGKPIPERVTGIDMVIEIARMCATHGYRLYLLGAAPGIAELAASKLQELAPGLEIAGTYAGSPDQAEEETIMTRIRTTQTDVLCVAYGSPTQELWIYRHRRHLSAGIAIGVGGTFDFLSGHQKRAPKSLQKLGLEWLYRLYREPWRWRRMLALPKFALQVLVRGPMPKGRGL
jgi:N-acetylglucosaminyldiphosphoundecaprenol N-acetyl-beta-D-mannosaminyltransferase